MQVAPDEDSPNARSQVDLSEQFVDDAWGTAKSLSSLQMHPDYKKWIQHHSMTREDVSRIERCLLLYKVEFHPQSFLAYTHTAGIPMPLYKFCSPVFA